jgi:hypothetical protein
MLTTSRSSNYRRWSESLLALVIIATGAWWFAPPRPTRQPAHPSPGVNDDRVASRTPAPHKLEGNPTSETVGLVGQWRADRGPVNLVDGVPAAPHKVERSNQAFLFNGHDSWINLPDTPSLQMTSSLTVEGWLKYTGPLTAMTTVLYRGEVAMEQEFNDPS